MTTWQDSFTDTLTCCSSAPAFKHRRVADVLLARSYVAQRACTAFDSRAPLTLQSNPAYRTLAELNLGEGDSLVAWATRIPAQGPTVQVATDKIALFAGHGGEGLARFYFVYRASLFPGTAVPRVPAPASVLSDARAEVAQLITELMSFVIDGDARDPDPFNHIAPMGSDAYATARQVWVDRLAGTADSNWMWSP